MKFLLALAVGFMTVTLFSVRLDAADFHLKDLFNLRDVAAESSKREQLLAAKGITADPSRPDRELFLAGKRGDWAGIIQQTTVHIENRRNDADTRRNAYLGRAYAHFRNGDKESGLADLKMAAAFLARTRAHWTEVAGVFYGYMQGNSTEFQESVLAADGIAICTDGLNAEIEGEPDKTAMAHLHRIRGILHTFEKNYEQAIDGVMNLPQMIVVSP